MDSNLDIPATDKPNDVLDSCKDEFTDIIVIGWTKDNQIAMKTSGLAAPELSYMLGKCQMEVMSK